MKLVVFSHKPCWASENSPTGFATDGGFPLQIGAIASLFDATELAVPCWRNGESRRGGTPIQGHNLHVVPLTPLPGRGLVSKLLFPFWLLRNTARIASAFRRANAVHAPIPGSVGTIGLVLALLFRKPLFVRHCGNWRKPRTVAERFWIWAMERFAGGRNVMLATGGDNCAPSKKNHRVKWVFSTSLGEDSLSQTQSRTGVQNQHAPRLVIACRQEKEKGTIRVIEALPELMESVPGIQLEVVGDGGFLPTLRNRAEALGLADRVDFRGHMPQAEVLGVMRRGDLFCYPTSASEGFPKVVLEAMASGLPIITTRVSVLPRLMEGGAGVLLDDDSPSSVARAVTDCLSSPERYSRMSVAAASTARSYSLERWSATIGEELHAAWGPLRCDA